MKKTLAILETAIADDSEKQMTDSDTRQVDIGFEDNDAFILENAVETDPIASFAGSFSPLFFWSLSDHDSTMYAETASEDDALFN